MVRESDPHLLVCVPDNRHSELLLHFLRASLACYEPSDPCQMLRLLNYQYYLYFPNVVEIHLDVLSVYRRLRDSQLTFTVSTYTWSKIGPYQPDKLLYIIRPS